MYIVNFEQVNVCLKSVTWHAIFIQAERDHRSTVFIVGFGQVTPSQSEGDIPETSPEGPLKDPNVRDLHGTSRGLLEEQHKN